MGLQAWSYMPCKALLLQAMQTPADSVSLAWTIMLEMESALAAAHLSACVPDIWVGGHACAVWAHVCLHNVLDHQALLKNGPIEHLPLHCQLDLQPPGMGLRPDEPRIHELHLIHAPQCLVLLVQVDMRKCF